MFENIIFEELLRKNHSDAELVKRISSVSQDLDFLFSNMEFCKAGCLIRSGRKYCFEDILILTYEFFLLARKFDSIPTEDIEVFLYINADEMKRIASEGKFSPLLDLM